MKILNGLDEIAAFLGVPVPAELRAVERVYPVRANTYYLARIDRADPWHDPIGRQCLPHPDELRDYDASDDPLAEEEQTVAPHLIRRYYDRAVMVATNRCPMLCRFCFRKRQWRAGVPEHDLTDDELAAICAYYRNHPEVRELLFSGGEPLMLSNARIRAILTRLTAVPSLEIIRIGSRAPVTWPERIDAELADMLGACRGVWFATHFNHPRELTPEAEAACTRLVRAGVPVVNQTVLLRGVNDDPEVLEALFRGLIRMRVKPLYLFHVDPVKGVRHFATGVARGREVLRYCRPRLSALAVPTFAIDLPEGGGKVPIQENYCENGRYETIFRSLVEYPEALD
ncbi:MAG: KamA family radical SAM protein [Victivallales bacterium]|nr:KamA family radical SAM protein [Victivallales bacterium]